jgi:hypothetical protein
VTTLAELRAALGTALSDIEGLAVHETLGGPYNPPCAVIQFPGTESYRDTMGRTGTIQLPFTVTVWVGRADDRIAQTNLDEYVDWVGDLSVPAALERDQTLAGVAQSVLIERFELIAPTVEGGDALGIVFGGFVMAQRERAV